MPKTSSFSQAEFSCKNHKGEGQFRVTWHSREDIRKAGLKQQSA